jgi:hypothetical protein
LLGYNVVVVVVVVVVDHNHLNQSVGILKKMGRDTVVVVVVVVVVEVAVVGYKIYFRFLNDLHFVVVDEDVVVVVAVVAVVVVGNAHNYRSVDTIKMEKLTK